MQFANMGIIFYNSNSYIKYKRPPEGLLIGFLLKSADFYASHRNRL